MGITNPVSCHRISKNPSVFAPAFSWIYHFGHDAKRIFFGPKKSEVPKMVGFCAKRWWSILVGSQSVKESLKQKQSHITNPKQLSGNLYKLMVITTVWVLRNLSRYMNFLPPSPPPKKDTAKSQGCGKTTWDEETRWWCQSHRGRHHRTSSRDDELTQSRLVESLRFCFSFMLRRMVILWWFYCDQNLPNGDFMVRNQQSPPKCWGFMVICH